MNTEILLKIHIDQLAFSPDFRAQSAAMGFMRLEDVLLLTPQELIKIPGFSYHWLSELSDFLQERELLHLLQTTPGKNPG